jgi:hypothetical protein
MYTIYHSTFNFHVSNAQTIVKTRSQVTTTHRTIPPIRTNLPSNFLYTLLHKLGRKQQNEFNYRRHIRIWAHFKSGTVLVPQCLGDPYYILHLAKSHRITCNAYLPSSPMCLTFSIRHPPLRAGVDTRLF